MFARTTPAQLFPSVAWARDLEPERAQAPNRDLTAKVESLIEPRPPLRPGATWQTDQRLHEDPDFAALVEIMTAATADTLERLAVEHEGFEITGCWANVAPPGGAHHAHHHPNNFLSGV